MNRRLFLSCALLTGALLLTAIELLLAKPAQGRPGAYLLLGLTGGALPVLLTLLLRPLLRRRENRDDA
ncbi:hypothetical protein [Desulfuromonas thiophila]|uniref:Uncharacterized protein n=1 Tax=Desulfuromonas thiophila TaxID=57664 RepID=A0A1G6ZSG8_9BACT|nr:hypothetical protein [Desulfuromonas thiophila]SDE05638.1 hypothetical protein SAMN05661003_103109 [Desulfuromonas thiophila]